MSTAEYSPNETGVEAQVYRRIALDVGSIDVDSIKYRTQRRTVELFIWLVQYAASQECIEFKLVVGTDSLRLVIYRASDHASVAEHTTRETDAAHVLSWVLRSIASTAPALIALLSGSVDIEKCSYATVWDRMHQGTLRRPRANIV